MSHVIGLKCRECGAQYPADIQNTCFECFGPLEVNYDWEYIKEKIGKGPSSIWRYADLLPVEGTDYIDLGAGFNKLHHARNLGKVSGLNELYILDESVNPTNSFKDRVTSVAVTKAIEFGATAVDGTYDDANRLASSALLCAIKRGYDELAQLGLIDSSNIKVSGAQPLGCSPIAGLKIQVTALRPRIPCSNIPGCHMPSSLPLLSSRNNMNN